MINKISFSLTQIEYVMAVHKFGHFAKAAQACNITQPTLSMQIQKLEEDLGITIFDRSKKPILLTSAGQAIIEQLQSVLFEAKKVGSILDSISGTTLTGDLVVGIIPTIAPYLLPKLLPTMDKLNTSVSLKIFEMQTHRIIEALNSDEIDVGVLATPLSIPKVFEYPLYYEPFSVLCRKDHDMSSQKKIKYSNLKYNDIWLLEEGHCLRNQVLDVCSFKHSSPKNRKYQFESGSLETLKNLIESYGGYTLLPALATSHLGDRSQIIPFERPIPSRQIGLVYRREHYKNELIEALGESIIQSLPDDIKNLRPKDLDVLPVE
jgi:LysR family hydrogen peroxide-inducible transcriptional activator